MDASLRVSAASRGPGPAARACPNPSRGMTPFDQCGPDLRPSNERDSCNSSKNTPRRRRSTALTGDHARIPRRTPPRNKGIRYPADPPRVEMAREGVPLNVIQPGRLLIVQRRSALIGTSDSRDARRAISVPSLPTSVRRAFARALDQALAAQPRLVSRRVPVIRIESPRPSGRLPRRHDEQA